MLLRLLTIAIIFLSCASCIAQELDSTNNAQLEKWNKKFPKADANRDGVLTKSEADAFRKAKGWGKKNNSKRPNPTLADQQYGPHERNVFDLWMPERDQNQKDSADKLPVFVYFHGGGFVGGDKSKFDPTPYVEAGMIAVSANYRLVDGKETLSPVPLHDAARVIQYLRTKTEEIDVDTDRIAIGGNSAGAVISMWIGYHDDLADASSEDVVLQQSSRVNCIVPMNGPTVLDPTWITRNMGGPKNVHGSFPKLFGARVDQFSSRPKVQARVKEASPMNHVSSDDPPTLLVYGGENENIPLSSTASAGKLIHHAYFGFVMKQKLDEQGVENQYLPGTNASGPTGTKKIIEWLSQKLQNSKH